MSNRFLMKQPQSVIRGVFLTEMQPLADVSVESNGARLGIFLFTSEVSFQ